MLVCFGGFFLDQKLSRLGYTSCHVCGVQVTLLFSYKLPGGIKMVLRPTFFHMHMNVRSREPKSWCPPKFSLFWKFKCIIAQRIGPLKKLFSHKRFDVMRSLKLDLATIFLGQKLPRLGNISYDVCGVQVSVVFPHKLHKLPCPWYASYRRVMFFNNFAPFVNVTTSFFGSY